MIPASDPAVSLTLTIGKDRGDEKQERGDAALVAGVLRSLLSRRRLAGCLVPGQAPPLFSFPSITFRRTMSEAEFALMQSQFDQALAALAEADPRLGFVLQVLNARLETVERALLDDEGDDEDDDDH